MFLSKSIYLSSEFNPAAFFVNANMVRIPEPLVVVFFISVSYPYPGQQNR